MKIILWSILLLVIIAVLPSNISSQSQSFDVLNYSLSLDIYSCFQTPFPASFRADEVITFKADSTLTGISLNAENNSLEIISVTDVNDKPLSFSHTLNMLNINFAKEFYAGEETGVKINYRHKNVTDSAFYSINGLVYTDCEPEGARRWFPCRDKPNDKATLDLTAKVPSGVKLGSNGKLTDSLITGDTLHYHWVSKEPVATYLIVIAAKTDYRLDIVYWHKLSNPADSLPIRFYYSESEDPKPMEELIGDLTTFYSEKFGELPYDKNGFASVNKDYNSEGMENQTLTILCGGCWNQTLIAHEYSHQWFGDLITCGSWADLWINEGLATYCEALYDEHRFGKAAYMKDITEDANFYMTNNPGWPVFNPAWRINTPSQDTLFNNSITYNKGACVLHMLRYVLGDSIFRKALYSYATDENYKFKNVYTEDLTENLSRYAGQDLSWFFNEWILQPNHPVYSNSYSIGNPANNKWKVTFTAKQIQTNTSFHKMPLRLKVNFAGGSDSTIKVMNDFNAQQFTFEFNKKPESLIFDPDNDIILKQADLTKN